MCVAALGQQLGLEREQAVSPHQAMLNYTTSACELGNLDLD